MAEPFETKKSKPQATEEPDVATTAAAAAARAVVEEMMPAMIAAMRSGNPGEAPPRVRQVDNGPTCPVCQQYVKACKGEHVQLCVYPTRYPEFGPWFQGARVNGVRYLSNGPGHEIQVPKASESDIRSMVSNYEDSERIARLGRVITPSKNSIVPRESVGEYR